MHHNHFTETETNDILTLADRMHATSRPVWLGVTDVGMTKQVSVHRTGRGETYLLRRKNRRRSPSVATTKKILTHLLKHHCGLVIFPADYDLVVVDVDSPTADILTDSFPPLHRSNTRSAYGYSNKPPGGGHLWYRRPRTLKYLHGLPHRSFRWRSAAHAVDLLYDRIVFVPPGEVRSLLRFLAEQMEQPRESAFPTEYLALHHHSPGDHRDDALYRYIHDQYDQSGEIDDEIWREVADTIGHTQKHGPEKLDDIITRIRSKDVLSSDPTHDPTVQEFSPIGFANIIRHAALELRFNRRTEQPEIRNRKHDHEVWLDVNHTEVTARLAHFIANHYRMPRGKITVPWDWARAPNSVLLWLRGIAQDTHLYDPWAEYLEQCRSAVPLSDDESLLLSLLSLSRPTTEAVSAVVEIEHNLLLTLHGRLTMRIDQNDRDIHFPVCPVLIGPPGIGKSRYCRELGMRGRYHTTSASFHDNTRVWAEKSRANIVIEVAELADVLGSRTGRQAQHIRGVAKDRLETTAFTFRAAYAPGSVGSRHRVSGVIIGTSNTPPETTDGDGLHRRLAPVHVALHPRFQTNFSLWSSVVEELLPRAMARAAHAWDDGFVPSNCEEAIECLRAVHMQDFTDTDDVLSLFEG